MQKKAQNTQLAGGTHEVPGAGAFSAEDWEKLAGIVLGIVGIATALALFFSAGTEAARILPIALCVAAAVYLVVRGRDSMPQRLRHREVALDRAEQEMLRIKEAFLANMSHEMRTPLTSILGFSQILREELGGEQREFVQLIEQNGQRLLDTLNSILELSWLEGNSTPIETQDVDVVRLVRSHVERFRAAAEQKMLSIAVIAGASNLHARIDRRALELILDKIVGNAIKFTEKGRVTVFVEAEEHAIHVAVRDTGIGISKTFLPRLFEAFWQESDGLARTHEGSGLGLAIAARLAERMNGAIRVQSDKGSGTTFVCSFPHAPHVNSGAAKTPASRAGVLLGAGHSWQPREREVARPLIGLSHGDGAAGLPSLEPVVAGRHLGRA